MPRSNQGSPYKLARYGPDQAWRVKDWHITPKDVEGKEIPIHEERDATPLEVRMISRELWGRWNRNHHPTPILIPHMISALSKGDSDGPQ